MVAPARRTDSPSAVTSRRLEDYSTFKLTEVGRNTISGTLSNGGSVTITIKNDTFTRVLQNGPRGPQGSRELSKAQRTELLRALKMTSDFIQDLKGSLIREPAPGEFPSGG